VRHTRATGTHTSRCATHGPRARTRHGALASSGCAAHNSLAAEGRSSATADGRCSQLLRSPHRQMPHSHNPLPSTQLAHSHLTSMSVIAWRHTHTHTASITPVTGAHVQQLHCLHGAPADTTALLPGLHTGPGSPLHTASPTTCCVRGAPSHPVACCAQPRARWQLAAQRGRRSRRDAQQTVVFAHGDNVLPQ
jgi:hypothetical protein